MAVAAFRCAPSGPVRELADWPLFFLHFGPNRDSASRRYELVGPRSAPPRSSSDGAQWFCRLALPCMTIAILGLRLLVAGYFGTHVVVVSGRDDGQAPRFSL